MLRDGLIEKDPLMALFVSIEPALIRYPALDPKSFRTTIQRFCHGADT
jgi:hypothetical protein